MRCAGTDAEELAATPDVMLRSRTPVGGTLTDGRPPPHPGQSSLHLVLPLVTRCFAYAAVWNICDRNSTPCTDLACVGIGWDSTSSAAAAQCSVPSAVS